MINMNKDSLHSWKEILALLFLFGIISAYLLMPFASSTMVPWHNDLLNHIVLIMQAKISLASGQFPLRTSVLNSLMMQPYPIYQFYSSTSYTIAAMIDKWITAGNPLMAYTITLWCALTMSGIYMYRLAQWFFKSKQAAVIASIVYLTTPYSLFVLYYFHGFNETLATCLIPAVLYYTLQRFYHSSRLKYFLEMTFLWYLLITIHLISFIYTSIFVGVFLVLLAIKNKKYWKNLFIVSIPYVFSLVLAAWFIGPLIIVSKYFLVNASFDDSKLLTAYAPSIQTILGWKYWQAIFNHHSVTNPSLGWPILISLIIILYAALSKKAFQNIHTKYWLTLLYIIFSLAIFMVWSPFNFWQWFPSQLLVVQATWRLYSQASWSGALIVAAVYIWVLGKHFNIKFFIISIALLIISAHTFIPKDPRYMPLSDFGENPKQASNPVSYLLDTDRNPSLIESIENLVLNTLVKDQRLQYDNVYVIPKSLLALAYSPFISLSGEFPSAKHSDLQLNAIIDGKIIATKNISSGKFNWKIPLTLKLYAKNQSKMSLSFKVNSPNKNHIKVDSIPISISNAILDGFLKSSEFLSLYKVMQDCHAENSLILCKVNVPANVHLLELPSFYYPQLLDIKLNGKPISYQAVLSESAALVGVIPEAGKINEFSIKFTGLAWANYISWGAWGLFSMIFLSFMRLPYKNATHQVDKVYSSSARVN